MPEKTFPPLPDSEGPSLPLADNLQMPSDGAVRSQSVTASEDTRRSLLFVEAPGSRCSESFRQELERWFDVQRRALHEDEDPEFPLSDGERILVDLSGLDGDGLDGALESLQESLGNRGGLSAWIALLAKECATRGSRVVERGAHSYFVAESARGEDVAAALESAEVWRARFEVERRKARAMESLVAQIPGILWTTDRESRLTSSRGPWLADPGRGHAAGVDPDPDELFAIRSSREEWVEAHRRALAGEEIDFEQEAGGKVQSGWIRPLKDVDGKVAGTIGLCVDVTRRRRLEDELRESRDRFETILENLPDPLGIYEAVRDENGDIKDFRVAYVNQAAVQANGIPRDRQIGGRLTELLPAHARTGLMDIYNDVVEREEAVRLESFSFSDPDGFAPVEGLFDIGAFKVGDGFGATWREVSERVRQAEQLRQSEKRLATVVQKAPLVIFTLDPDGIITLSVGGALARLELEAGEIVGRSMLDLYRHDPEQHRQLEAALAGEQVATVTPFEKAIFAIQYSPLHDADGTLVGTIGVATDITERHQLEEQLHQAQKMEAVGQLASGVAHDFNNLLTAIKGNAQFLALEKLPEDSAVHVDEIVATADRATLLTRQLLAFSRRESRAPRTVDLNEIIQGTLQLIRRVIGTNIEVVTRLHEEPVFAHVDRNRHEQILLNLAVNARDAMPGGGELYIETGTVEVNDRIETSHGEVPPGRWAQIVVRDTGTGMPAEVRRRIFEPFYTTKKTGEGTGLGLSTVWGMVTEAGGHIHVYSEPGQGTLFRIYLPLLLDPAEPAAEAPASPALRRPVQPSTILLVEDEPAVRRVACRLLTRAGHTVLEAFNGAHALELLSGRDAPVDLVLTDVVMPELTGPELVERLRGRWPAVNVLFMSGYSGQELKGKCETVEGARFIQKPFDLSALMAAVEGILSEEAGEN